MKLPVGRIIPHPSSPTPGLLTPEIDVEYPA
jgi:hypothetical protein